MSDLNEYHYYPFGMFMEGNNTLWGNGNGYNGGLSLSSYGYAYFYNAKEWNKDNGLNWYDYGKRWYDPAIGRFPSVDPIIDKFPYLTPYNYASNDPVKNIDLWGLQGVPASKYTQIVQRFKYDVTDKNVKMDSGTDVITKTVVASSRGESGEIRTTSVTEMSVDAKGKINKNATQFAFTEAGTGEKRTFAMTPVSTINSSDTDKDLQSTAEFVARYKEEKGRSELQNQADDLNSNIGRITGIVTSLATLRSGAKTSILTGTAANEATILLKISPELLSKEHKQIKEEIKK